MTVDRASTCALCRMSLPDAGHRTCALDLCEACYVGDLGKRLAGRGFAIKVETWVHKATSDDGVDTHHTRVTGTVATPVQPHATFTREQLGHRIRRWFGKGDIEVADPLFDDSIWVETDTDSHTRAMLRELGIQDVILEAVHDFGSICFIPVEGGCAVVAHTTWSSRQLTPDAESHQRIVACALHYLQRAKLESAGSS